MPRIALGLVALGLVAILTTLLLVFGAGTLPGGVPPMAAALLAALGGVALVGGLFLLEPRARDPQRPFETAGG